MFVYIARIACLHHCLVIDKSVVHAERNVAQNFAFCEANAQGRSARKRAASLANAKRVDGATPLFSRRTRAALAPDLQQAILEANWMDVALHRLAQELNAKFIEEAEAEHGGRLPVRT